MYLKEKKRSRKLELKQIILFSFVGDCQMSLALKMFIEEKGQELLEKKLYRNFVLHLCNMFEFGVLGPGHVFSAITRLQQFIKECGLTPMLTHWNSQLNSALIGVGGGGKKSSVVESQRKDFSGIFKSEQQEVEVKSKQDKGNAEETNTAIAEEQESLTKTTSDLKSPAWNCHHNYHEIEYRWLLLLIKMDHS